MLCSVHVNFSLLIKALNSVTLDKPSFSLFPDHFSQVMTKNHLDALLQSIKADEVTMKIWKKEQDPFMPTKKLMLIVLQQKEKEELKKNIHLQIQRVLCTYEADQSTIY